MSLIIASKIHYHLHVISSQLNKCTAQPKIFDVENFSRFYFSFKSNFHGEIFKILQEFHVLYYVYMLYYHVTGTAY